MTATELRGEIDRALRAVWPGFAAAHPALAGLLDRGMVLDAAADHFADDSDYQHALADASARGVPEQEMSLLVRGLVRGWLYGIPGGGRRLPGRTPARGR